MSFPYEKLPKRTLFLLELFSFGMTVLLVGIAFLICKESPSLLRMVLFVIGAAELFFALFRIPFYHASFRYAISEKEICLKRGAFFRKIHLLKRDQITFVSLYRDPISSLFGLSTVVITSPGASLTLPFLHRKRALQIAEELSHHPHLKEIQ